MIGKLLSTLLAWPTAAQYIMDLPEEFVELSNPHPHHDLDTMTPYPKVKRQVKR